jgi:CRP-like cAMP-binding protein
MTDRISLIQSLTAPFQSLTLEEQEAFADALTPFSYKRKEVITTQGQVQRTMLIVTEGVQYSYFVKEGKMHVLAFTYPVSVTGVPESFFTQTPSPCTLEALTPSKGFAISFEQMQNLNDQYRNIERLNRKMLEAVFVGTIQRHYELLSTSAEERFLAFAKRSPHLFQLVPHKLIASYLRIDATNFSRFYNSLRI